MLLLIKESGPAAIHPWSRRLASYSGCNTTRDFWQFCKTEIVARLQSHDVSHVTEPFGSSIVFKNQRKYSAHHCIQIQKPFRVYMVQCHVAQLLRKVQLSKCLSRTRKIPGDMSWQTFKYWTPFRWQTMSSTGLGFRFLMIKSGDTGGTTDQNMSPLHGHFATQLKKLRSQ